MPIEFHSVIIPRSFRLGGFKIDIRLDDTLTEKENVIGQNRYDSQELILDTSVSTLQFIEQTYCSALVDWILFVMGEHEIRGNKQLVEVFSQFLYQALTTAEPMPALEHEDNNEDLLPDPEEDETRTNHDWSYCIRIRWWGEDYSVDDYCEGDYDEIEYYECEDDWDGIDEGWDDSHNEDDYDPHEEDYRLAQEEWEEEEDSRREMQSEGACWTEYSDSSARSDDEGWFYSDDD
jgi:hypothetical protein